MKKIVLFSTFFLVPFLVDSFDSNINRKIERRSKKLFGPDTEVVLLENTPPKFANNDKHVFDFFALQHVNETKGYVVHGKANICYFGGCNKLEGEAESNKKGREEVKYIAYFNDAQEVLWIDIVDFESSYGYEIAASWWLKQFYNRKPGQFEIGNNIDGISGATVSCEQFVDEMNALVSE